MFVLSGLLLACMAKFRIMEVGIIRVLTFLVHRPNTTSVEGACCWIIQLDHLLVLVHLLKFGCRMSELVLKIVLICVHFALQFQSEFASRIDLL